ncbi:S-layer homology domain-containing protein [Sedimentibacter hydroxybenzoicus DSM 7310]|uniref:S-layer homology domain-containing protein n=1 Tax=Sedimentibacter hydroxybenzoicus DSM 7310 TaxID=1123245 RepID=A0A974BGE8_SEDHY|nr:S-layer homology domain-containing protein [Sedimentibacter hydroxybenzoicus]NYB72618.1 S-layer homology domain-containing protein [Sedimentibacter hydroxybenzoicus DSM 7310]
MKKITIITITLIIIFSIFNIGYGAITRNIKANFTVSDISGTNFKEITITPYDNYDDEDGDEKEYTIYLPTGYYIQGKSASFVADRNGRYPFTVYYGTTKKTFTYTVKGVENTGEDNDEDNDVDKKDISIDYSLMYDYEKKQTLFNIKLDKLRSVTTPGGTSETNEINYYIKDLKNNIPFDLTVTIDGHSYDFKIIKSGEFYLLIYISPVNYNDYSTVVEYKGYNFTNNEVYTTNPSKDIYDDNGNYQVSVKSGSSQHIFNFNITGIDYRRPFVDAGLFNRDKFYLEAEDDFGLDYMITFDGKYVPIKNTPAKETFTYDHDTEIRYNGEYIFVVVDKKGNRTVETVKVNSLRKPLKNRQIDYDVHDNNYAEKLFENIGLQYKSSKDEEEKLFDNILPAYMNGKSPDKFGPDLPISRAEMVTIFCRLNNLPYDNSAYLKAKFTDIQDHWARDYIAMGSSKKYVSGYKDKTFKPDNNVTRAEFCQMLTKISAYKSYLNAIPASNNTSYTDIKGHWAEKEIIKIAGRNLIESDSNFYPDKPITRGEVVHAINMLYGFSPSYIELGYTNTLYNKNFNFQDIYGHKYYNDIIISVVGMYREKIN